MKGTPFFMVFTEGQNAPTYKHQDLESAENEAKRLAKISDCKTYVLASIKSFEEIKFKIEDCRPNDDLPF